MCNGIIRSRYFTNEEAHFFLYSRDREERNEGRKGKQLVTRQGKRKGVEFNFGKGSDVPGETRTWRRNEKGPINGIDAQYIE